MLFICNLWCWNHFFRCDWLSYWLYSCKRLNRLFFLFFFFLLFLFFYIFFFLFLLFFWCFIATFNNLINDRVGICRQRYFLFWFSFSNNFFLWFYNWFYLLFFNSFNFLNRSFRSFINLIRLFFFIVRFVAFCWLILLTIFRINLFLQVGKLLRVMIIFDHTITLCQTFKSLLIQFLLFFSSSQ